MATGRVLPGTARAVAAGAPGHADFGIQHR